MAEKRAVELHVWGGTDVGMKRRMNEDVYLVDEDAGLYLVADGMGGHAAGDVASRLAAREIQERFRQSLPQEDGTWPESWDATHSSTANRLVDAIQAGHERVTHAVEGDASLKGMGTTVVAAVHPPGTDRLIIAHVGDSRAYLLRRGEFVTLTTDHSWVSEQVAAGFLTQEAARFHPLKNVVTQALGGSYMPRVDILETTIEPGDLYLLCSDGLNTMLTDEAIARLLQGPGSLEEIGKRLIVAANQAGGNDNITVILLSAV